MLKTAIVYFSQTGNTNKLAEAIADGLQRGGLACDLVPLVKADPQNLLKYDAIGLGNPVFFWKPPFPMRQFIARLPSLVGKKAFVFCTYGTHRSTTLSVMARSLMKKGLQVVDSFAARGFDSYPIYREWA